MARIQINVVSDCGENDRVRIATVLHDLFEDAAVQHSSGDHPLSAACQMVDLIGKMRRRGGAVICNNAPRGQKGEENGSQICFGRIGKVTLVTTVITLPFIMKFFPKLEVRLVEEKSVIDSWNVLHTEDLSLEPSQFRGADVIPYLLRMVVNGEDDGTVLKSEVLKEPPKLEGTQVVAVDTIWGSPCNLKLSATAADVPGLEAGSLVHLMDHEGHCLRSGGVKYHTCLKDVPPDGRLALITGSSGVQGKRQLELVVMGKSAAQVTGLKAGDTIALEVQA